MEDDVARAQFGGDVEVQHESLAGHRHDALVGAGGGHVVESAVDSEFAFKVPQQGLVLVEQLAPAAVKQTWVGAVDLDFQPCVMRQSQLIVSRDVPMIIGAKQYTLHCNSLRPPCLLIVHHHGLVSKPAVWLHSWMTTASNQCLSGAALHSNVVSGT